MCSPVKPCLSLSLGNVSAIVAFRSSCGSCSYDTRIVVRDINALRCFAYSFTLMTTDVFSYNGRFIYFILVRCMLIAIITRAKMFLFL